MEFKDLDKLSLDQVIEEKNKLTKEFSTIKTITIICAVFAIFFLFAIFFVKAPALKFLFVILTIIAVALGAYKGRSLEDIEKRLKYYNSTIKIRSVEHIKMVERKAKQKTFENMSEEAQDELLEILDEDGE